MNFSPPVVSHGECKPVDQSPPQAQPAPIWPFPFWPTTYIPHQDESSECEKEGAGMLHMPFDASQASQPRFSYPYTDYDVKPVSWAPAADQVLPFQEMQFQYPSMPPMAADAFPPSTSQQAFKPDPTAYYQQAQMQVQAYNAMGGFAAETHPAFMSWKAPSAKPSKLEPAASDPPYRVGPGTNNVRVRTSDKYRMVYSDYQRLELEKEFHTTQFVTAERKAELSTSLRLTERQIKIWFQNRRAKDRRDGKGGKKC